MKKQFILKVGALILLLKLFCSSISAQSGGAGNNQDKFLPNITPPSPQASSLGNYGNIPVGLFTGTANISVPLLDYKTSDIEIPLNLFYGSNGVKVDDISGTYGLGWNLNVGGVITRTVRDLADELQQGVAIPETATGGYGNAIASTFFNLAGSSAADTEQDLYTFSYNGNAGKFVLDRNGNPVLATQQKIKLESLPAMEGFIITHTDGIKYYFTEMEQTIFRSMGAGHSIPQRYPTAWYLTKMVHPSGEEVYFTYASNNYNYTASELQNLSFSYPAIQYGCENTVYTKTAQMSGIVAQTIQIAGKKITKISSNNPVYGEIRFIYNSAVDTELTSGANNKIVSISKVDKNSNLIDQVNFSFLTTTNKRNFLERLAFKDTEKSYGFEYVNPTAFPARLSKSQDHWGYFNGQANSSIVPAKLTDYGLENMNYSGANKEPQADLTKTGMLRKIIYPTKGHTEFDYEGNDYFGTKTVNPPLVREFLTVLSDEDGGGTKKAEYIINNEVQQRVKLSGGASFNAYCSQEHNLPHLMRGFITVTNLTDNTDVQLMTLSAYGTYVPSATNQIITGTPFYFSAAPGKSYKVVLSISGRCVGAHTSVEYLSGTAQTIQTNLPTGGIRIKSQRDVSENANIYKRYFYANKNALNKSSGNKGKTPIYYDLNTIRNTCPGGLCIYYDLTDMVVNSASMLSLFDTGNSNCYYKDVTISEGGDNFENGGETKSFRINRDVQGNTMLGRAIYSSPWTNFGWDNGQELFSEVFDKNQLPIRQVTNEYKVEEAYDNEVKSYAVRKNFDLVCGETNLHTCTRDETQNYSENPCYGKAEGTQLYIPDVSNLDVVEYKLLSNWSHLSSQKTTEFRGGTPIVSHTEYLYNNPVNYQLSKLKSISPDGVINETSYKYAHEKGNQPMIAKNMIDVAMETTATQTIGGNTKTLSHTEAIYPSSLPHTVSGNLVKPLSLKSYNKENNTPSTEIDYDRYDSKGNLQQYTTKDGISTTIIWGYSQTQPIAKIEGAKLQDIPQNLIDSIVNTSNSDAQAGSEASESALISALDSFRTHSALSGYQISTYTYDTLIGVRSITPPSGIREIYLYDSANRLEKIVDANGKVLKEYQYHYKN